MRLKKRICSETHTRTKYAFEQSYCRVKYTSIHLLDGVAYNPMIFSLLACNKRCISKICSDLRRLFRNGIRSTADRVNPGGSIAAGRVGTEATERSTGRVVAPRMRGFITDSNAVSLYRTWPTLDLSLSLQILPACGRFQVRGRIPTLLAWSSCTIRKYKSRFSVEFQARFLS